MIPYTTGKMSIDTLQTLSISAVGVVSLYTVITLVDYFYANRKYIKKLVKS